MVPHNFRLRVAALLVASGLFGGCYRHAQVYPPPAPATVTVAVDSAPIALPEVIAVRQEYRDTTLIIELPPVAREFRGVWIATVANMDWPTRRSLSTAQAQQELLRILDTARDMGLNAVVLQVRPMGDAFYQSALEPWSDYLTGASGRAPEPYWDPLQFAVEQAHARGLELHAWFNPFRSSFVSKQTPLAANHISRRRPDLVVRYGTHYWMDPGFPEVREHALAVVRDVVRRYDIDAVHIDDYFYPYREYDARGRLIEFPDDVSWRRHGAATGMSRSDWRRDNVNRFVEALYHGVRAEKQHVRVGISPFGIWRPGYPSSVRGLDSYHELFADTRKWWNNGWADYYAPQLYWRTYAPQQDYASLLQWWVDQNTHGRHLWPGNMPNNVTGTQRGWNAAEIVEQVKLTRENTGASGNVHFSASSLLRNTGGVRDTLRTRVYTDAALVPASPWLATAPVGRPQATAMMDPAFHATAIHLGTGLQPTTWIVRARWGEEWQTLLLPGSASETHVDWMNGSPPDLIAVSAVDRVGVESEPTLLLNTTVTVTAVRLPAR